MRDKKLRFSIHTGKIYNDDDPQSLLLSPPPIRSPES